MNILILRIKWINPRKLISIWRIHDCIDEITEWIKSSYVPILKIILSVELHNHYNSNERTYFYKLHVLLSDYVMTFHVKGMFSKTPVVGPRKHRHSVWSRYRSSPISGRATCRQYERIWCYHQLNVSLWLKFVLYLAIFKMK